MTENISIILIAVVYKIVTMGIGLLFGYMGYRLFISGIWGNSGNVDVDFMETKLVVRKAAPGTFFVLFGAGIITFSVFTGINWHDKGQFHKPGVELPDKPPF